MRMIFEIRDLTYATPASVSRAGILYISSVEGKQWRSLIASWVMKSDYDESVKSQLSGLFETYVPKAVKVLSNQMKTVVDFEPITAVSALLQVWYSMEDRLSLESDKKHASSSKLFNYSTIVGYMSISLYTCLFVPSVLAPGGNAERRHVEGLDAGVYLCILRFMGLRVITRGRRRWDGLQKGVF